MFDDGCTEVTEPERTHDDHGERAAGLVEYALLIALIAIVALVAVQFLGEEASTSFSQTARAVSNA